MILTGLHFIIYESIVDDSIACMITNGIITREVLHHLEAEVPSR